MLGHEFGQHGHQLPAAHQWRRRHADKLADGVAAQHGARFQLDVVDAERRRYGMGHDVIAHLKLPRHGLAGGGVAKPAAAVLRQVFDAGGCAMAGQVVRRGAHHQLQRHQAPRNHAALGRVARAETHVHPVLHPVADAVVQLNIGLHERVAAAEHVEHGPDHLQHDGAWCHDAQRPRNLLAPAPRAVHRPLQGREARLRGLQKLAPLLGQAQAARGAVEQPHAQVRFELPQRQAGGLRGDALGRGSLPQAAQFGGFGKRGNGTQFIDGHGVRSEVLTSFTCE